MAADKCGRHIESGGDVCYNNRRAGIMFDPGCFSCPFGITEKFGG